MKTICYDYYLQIQLPEWSWQSDEATENEAAEVIHPQPAVPGHGSRRQRGPYKLTTHTRCSLQVTGAPSTSRSESIGVRRNQPEGK